MNELKCVEKEKGSASQAGICKVSLAGGTIENKILKKAVKLN